MQLKDVAPSFILALIMAIPVYAISFLSWSQFIILPLQIVLGVMLAVYLCELFKRDEYLQLKEIAMSYLKKT
jgi:chromate transport protein ChrA